MVTGDFKISRVPDIVGEVAVTVDHFLKVIKELRKLTLIIYCLCEGISDE